MEESSLTELIIPKSIDKDLMDLIIKKILQNLQPEKIILFGSHARNQADEHSDLDILIIIKESDIPRYRRAVPIRIALSNIIFPMDILIYTENEIDEWSEVPQAFITSIIQKGVVIYEKK